jgi:hypothetical protein
MWWKISSSGKKEFICDAADCTIDGPLHNEDSGQYFCEVYDSFGEKDYYVNVTILAPPSIKCNMCRCNERANKCYLPLLEITVNNDIQLRVQFYGIGPFTVLWLHNGHPITNCSNDTSDITRCKVTRFLTPTHGYEILTLHGPHYSTSMDSGIFTANVSNPYGYNMTLEDVQITCKPYDPPSETANKTVDVPEGESMNISLSTRGNQEVYLWLCYSTDEYITMYNISLNESCIKCCSHSYTSVECGTLPNHPQWNVTRIQHGTCLVQMALELSVFVTDVDEKDSGKFMLAWSSDDEDQGPQYHHVLTVTSLNVTTNQSRGGTEELNTHHVIIYSTAGGSAGLLVVLGIVVFVGVKRKGKRVQRQPRPRRRHHDRAGALYPNMPQLGSSSEADVDSDEEVLVNPDRPAPYYGSFNRGCINQVPDTSENDDVTLPSQSDDNNSVLIH